MSKIDLYLFVKKSNFYLKNRALTNRKIMIKIYDFDMSLISLLME